jgi:hypothetical protein
VATTLFEEVTCSPSKLVEEIEMGEIDLRDLRRPFVRKNHIFRGHPVGRLSEVGR